MADFAIRYNDFSGGDSGLFDMAKPADKTFRDAHNVYPYRSGLLGVRTGLKRLTVTGLPGYPFVPGPVGFDVWNGDLILSLDHLYRVPMAGGAAVALDPYPVAVTQRTSFARADNKLFSLSNGVLYEHDLTTTTPVTTPAPLSIVVRWGLFLVGVDRNVPWRIWFSQVDAAGPAFSTWPATNFLDISNNEPITALTPIFNTLFVGKSSGWFAVTGVLGAQASVREVTLGNGPVDQRFTSLTTDNRVVYWPLDRVPAWWNGERVYLDERYQLAPRQLPYLTEGVIVTPTSRRLVLASENDAGVTDLLTWADSAWTRQIIPYSLTGLTPPDVRSGYQMPAGVIYAVRRPSAIAEQPVILSWAHDLDRPGHALDQYAAPNDFDTEDAVAGSFSLPDWYEGQGRQIRVRSVIVQFRKWSSGVPNMRNRLQVEVTALGAYGRGEETSKVAKWVEDESVATREGVNDSLRMNFGNQGVGNGFRIRVADMQGIAIREIVALVDLRTTRT